MPLLVFEFASHNAINLIVPVKLWGKKININKTLITFYVHVNNIKLIMISFKFICFAVMLIIYIYFLRN